MYSLNLFHPKIKSKNLFIDFIDIKKSYLPFKKTTFFLYIFKFKNKRTNFQDGIN